MVCSFDYGVCSSIVWWYAFCMVFHVRWIFLTTSLRIPPSRVATRVGFEDEWWEIHLTWKTIQNAFSRILYTLMHFNQVKYYVQSCRSWKPCEMDLSHNCSLHGGIQKYARMLILEYQNIIENNRPLRELSQPTSLVYILMYSTLYRE